MAEQARFWVAHDLQHTDALRATYIRHAFRPHAHPEYAIGIIEHGAQSVQFRTSREVLPAGTLALINPGEVHTGHAQTEQGWTYRMLYPSETLVASVLPGLTLPWFKEATVFDGELFQMFQTLHRVLEDPQGSVLERQSRWAVFMSVLAQRHAAQRAPLLAGAEHAPRAVELARQRLEAAVQSGAAVSLEELAGAAGLPVLRLLRAFRAATGLPPHAYQTLLRVQRARSLLRGGVPLTEAALLAGFYDQSHLGKQFKQVYGLSPGQYARGTGTPAAFSPPSAAKTS
ncbi:AraC family transcriptional regulator [Deinococcus ruber]|uniref:Transcriptional regulator n=1 Tax=Deinococcus ruber TaxID=1848197 RepID=A0A918BVG8_9DEIO|nr:AraC family transcriptional regulator [Deinococcus ruber]GGQ92845.1 transcriptional regulator [Deinococcus ruber]